MVRANEKSAEAVVVRKSRNGDGAKGRRTSNTHQTSQENARSILKWADATQRAAIPPVRV